MCGINGAVSKRPLDTERLSSALDFLQHRGPDSRGCWQEADATIWLGHRRLAILDLSEKAAQPMEDERGRTVITFNGEIYNYSILKQELVQKGYRFQSESDTEVILHAYACWGIDCVKRLNGMFAFTLYDRNQRKLYAARDRAGEKPFYYYRGAEGFYFSSELKALLTLPQLPRKLSLQGLDEYLAYGTVLQAHCLVEGYQKLLPGHVLELDTETLECKVYTYWQLPESVPVSKELPELLAELGHLLEQSVQRQLVADVPVGILLSGGLDSSIITAIASKVQTNVRTYTVSFPGDKQKDESRYAAEVASYFGTQHTVLESEAVEVELLEQLAIQFDEPMADPSLIPTSLLCKQVREHCTVALGGDGADELFGGYHRYQELLRLEQQLNYVPKTMRSVLHAASFLPTGFKGRHRLLQAANMNATTVPNAATLFTPKERRQLVCNKVFEANAEIFQASVQLPSDDLADRCMRNDFHLYLADDLLVKTDRASMLSSLEVRAPFLDQDLIEWSFNQVPSSLKVNTKDRKILLKAFAKTILPTNFDFNRKQGFVPPLEQWLQSKSWQLLIEDTLLADTQTSFFNTKMISHLLKGQAKGRYNKRRIFALLLFALWRKHYRITID
jgi:asparagine synthase (glutamine-hydrolysing)